VPKLTTDLCANAMPSLLADIRTELAAAMDLSDAERLGFKVWVLPPKYYWLVHHGWHFPRAWADLVSLTLNMFQLVEVGALRGSAEGPEPSGTTWTVGKGLLGQAIFGPDESAVLIHHRDWQEGIEDMPPAEFRRLPRSLRRGRSQEDFRGLRAKYGSSIAVGLRPAHGAAAFGCITAHTDLRYPLSDDQGVQGGEALALIARSVAVEAISTLGYPATPPAAQSTAKPVAAAAEIQPPDPSVKIPERPAEEDPS
jgi:hypothetical protein